MYPVKLSSITQYILMTLQFMQVLNSRLEVTTRSISIGWSCTTKGVHFAINFERKAKRGNIEYLGAGNVRDHKFVSDMAGASAIGKSTFRLSPLLSPWLSAFYNRSSYESP